MSREAFVQGISYYLPESSLTNQDLKVQNPDWDVDRLEVKTGVRRRHVAGPNECSSDLAVQAAASLLAGLNVPPEEVDFLLFCTQSPDYFLPTTACGIHRRLGMRRSAGALDFNLGCSGYVYGLYLAKGLIASGLASKVLLLTGETYTKFIHPRNRTVRFLFGDAGSATLVSDDASGARIGAFDLGTDGTGGPNLIVRAGALRFPRTPEAAVERADPTGSVETDDTLTMDGQEVFVFTLARVPEMVGRLLNSSAITTQDVDLFVFHQANAFMNEALRAKLRIPRERCPVVLAETGNTVSNTIPITLCESGPALRPGQKILLAGFGVGYSWGAALLDWGRVLLQTPKH